MEQPYGFIFDWDGVIIDSHAQHEESWKLLFEELKQEMPPHFFKETFGMRNQQIIPMHFNFVDPSDHETIQKLGDRKEVLYREIIARDGIEPLPGVLDLLCELKELGIPTCVGSSTPRANLEFIMERTHLREYFFDMVGAEDVTQGKPAPDVFLKAAQKIQRDPAQCLVFEDAFVGIDAALAAKMKVLAVATTHPLEKLQGKATLAVQSLTEITAAGLIETLLK